MCMPASKRFQVRVANAIRYIVKVCSLVTVQTVMLLAPNSFLNLSKVITQSILQIKSQSLSSHINYHYLMVKDHKKSNVRSPCSSGKFIEIPHIILINFRSYQSTKTEQQQMFYEQIMSECEHHVTTGDVINNTLDSGQQANLLFAQHQRKRHVPYKSIS